MEKYIQIETTFEKHEEALKLAKLLLDAKLVADGQITEIRSAFNWEGKFYDRAEWLLLSKTRADLYLECEAFIKHHHSFKVPQIVAIELVGGSLDYFNWIDESVKHNGENKWQT
ncbi:MAG: divalent-cation tolerance protein CutA [Firmicutes bacterium]|nr:divalent-cation tolerance protein CutA [Bacillota bacterium]